MYRMDKLTTGIAYGASAGNAGFWMLQVLDKVSPSQWAAIGVLGSLLLVCLRTRRICISKLKMTGAKRHGVVMGNRAKLSAAMLALMAAGASAPTLMDQFLDEKEGKQPYSVSRWQSGDLDNLPRATRIDGKPVTQGMKLTQAKCDQVNAIERDKALAWVDRNIHVPLTPPQK